MQYGAIVKLDIDNKYGWSIAMPALIIAVGGIVFVVPFFACCGAIRKNRSLLYTVMRITFSLTMLSSWIAMYTNALLIKHVGVAHIFVV